MPVHFICLFIRGPSFLSSFITVSLDDCTVNHWELLCTVWKKAVFQQRRWQMLTPQVQFPVEVICSCVRSCVCVLCRSMCSIRCPFIVSSPLLPPLPCHLSGWEWKEGGCCKVSVRQTLISGSVFLQTTWVGFQVPTWWFTTFCHSGSRGSDAPSSGLGGHQAHIDTHAGKTIKTLNKKKNPPQITELFLWLLMSFII